MTNEKKDFIKSIIEDHDILTYTMRDYYEMLEMTHHSIKEVFPSDEELFHMIYCANIPSIRRKSLLTMLKEYTDNGELKEVIDNTIERSDFAREFFYNADSSEFAFNLYAGICDSSALDFGNIQSEYRGTFSSVDEAVSYIKYFNSECIKENEGYEEILEHRYYLLTKDTILKNSNYKSDRFIPRYGFIIMDYKGNALYYHFDQYAMSQNAIHVSKPHPFIYLDANIKKHPFSVGDIVYPRWDGRNMEIKDSRIVYFVSKNQNKKNNDGKHYTSGLILDCYDTVNNRIYTLDSVVSPFSLDKKYNTDYETEGELFDFVTKYSSFLKGKKEYTLIDVLNSFVDLKKGN